MVNNDNLSLLEEDALALTQAALRISKALEEGDDDAIAQALDDNLELWVGIRTLVARQENQLPAEVKDNLTKLSHFVSQKTLEMRDGLKTETLEALVNTNLQIAEGLLEGMGKGAA
ncbi:flagellar biosynthesis regulator FlaF [Roseospirillum parvum]|uniref:Flagellar biosynthesis regulator FlaF n=1 Tax=Roseospirillum parvum TaxID=83401 RepID=A0A1G8FFM0_9PROT|nr:flagellar biosynthesis regulator FlaF [Roseospirillum parvum]SDH80809.1 Flagellar biosynthesis regulator FlaF [Roseospirillum parvum]